MYKVLIAPWKTQLGTEAIKSLTYSKHFEVVKDTCTKIVFDEGYEEELEEQAINCDLILVTHDEGLYKASKNSNLHKKLVFPGELATYACRWKNLTLFHLSKHAPKFYDAPSKENLPLFVKPRNGQGSKGIYQVVKEEDLETLKLMGNEVIFCEYLPGREYTIDCYSNNKCDLLFFSARERVTITNGVATETTIVEDQRRFEDIVKNAVKALPFKGAWFIQVKENVNGELKVMEAAARFGGSSGINRFNNVNMVELSLWDKLGMQVEVTPQNFCTSIKKTIGETQVIHAPIPEHIYVDLDDTLIIKGEPNPKLFTWCYKKRLERHTVTILTRNQTLNDIFSWPLFNGYMQVPPDKNKTDYMVPGSLLIDDSFRERNEAIKAGHFALSPYEAEQLS